MFLKTDFYQDLKHWLRNDFKHKNSLKNDVGLILLAAGNSSRMGQCKYLLPLENGKTFYENIVRSFFEFGIRKIVVVTQNKYSKELKSIFEYKKKQPLIIINYFPEKERFYSLQLGIEKMDNIEFCYIHNADSPFVTQETLQQLYANKHSGDYVCPVFEGKSGHPILANKKTLQHLINCPEQSILRDELKKFKRKNIEVRSNEIVVDIDTQEDYKNILSGVDSTQLIME